MYLIAIGWLYVALMMAVAEAGSPSGSVIGGVTTFLAYGALPLGLVLYIGGAPARRRRRRAAEARERAEASAREAPEASAGIASSPEPDRGGHATGHPVAPEREEP